ncbi:MAG TPA: RagB/SusD family nutrient uptake outer membrane protein, partial [Phnomibacter sp.]|nr:RagB/SusD family nutrient uptake outer membrane protein [Phnomibacter sp.]
MRKITTIILASGLLMGSIGCKKLLEIYETDSLVGDAALRTVSNVEQATIGAYGALRIEMEILLNATFTDEVRTAGEFYNAATTHEWQYNSQDVGLRDNYTAISPQYTMINRVNLALSRVAVADSTLAGDNAKRNRLRGELLFMRAWAHFTLFQYYCANYNPDADAMPYMETSTIVKFPRIKQGPYFQKLLADITEAKSLLPNNLTDIGRANFAAASALHARIALYMRDWAAAEANATAYINALPLASRAAFPGIWTDANTQEVAFILRRTENVGGRIGSLFRGTSSVAGGNLNIGTIVWQPTDELYNAYDKDNDIRFSSYFKDEPLLLAIGRTGRLVKKYEGGAYGTATENLANAKVFRTGEMYLIRAEA